MRKGAWIIVILLIGTLFFLSSIPGLRVLPVLKSINSILISLDLTVIRFSEWLASLIPLDFNELRYIDTLTQDFLIYARENPIIIEFFLRKLAHIFIFFIITIAVFFLLHQYVKKSYAAVVLSLLMGGALSYLDEYRQSFVDGRYSSMVDVFINMIGVTLAICLIMFSLFITKRGRCRIAHHEKSAVKQQQENAPG
ncbi:VanZ family protein [Desulfitibacter alkalitolerans]|uniref:VanZ family protein n=1 Tax=Desulfitibacter alkalitolerans TaxID=264641 RepID=UPI00048839E3|nr:VanZ family protein [Desulfitibacter alkalitolerans]